MTKKIYIAMTIKYVAHAPSSSVHFIDNMKHVKHVIVLHVIQSISYLFNLYNSAILILCCYKAYIN